jgi:hypothetical protein
MANTSSPSLSLGYIGYGFNSITPPISISSTIHTFNCLKLNLYGFISDTNTASKNLIPSTTTNTHYPFPS